MTRRLAVLLALLASLLALPSVASAARPGSSHQSGGGATATTIQEVVPDEDTGGADVPDGSVDPEDADDDPWGDDAAEDPWAPERDATRAPAPDPAILVPVPRSRRTVEGRIARIRTDGRAAIPRSAPKRVKRVLAAANLIVGKPYKWGGGHAKLFDTGYDCSGAVGYALIRAGLLNGSMVSGSFAKWARAGAGRWISIHANRGHVYLEIAGLRLDTSAVADPGGRKGVRWRPVIGRRAGFHTRHLAGL